MHSSFLSLVPCGLGDDSYPHNLAAQRGVWNVLEKAVGRSCLGQIPTNTVITLARGKGHQ